MLAEHRVDRAGSAFAEADPAGIDFAGALDGAAVFHCGGITPAPRPRAIQSMPA